MKTPEGEGRNVPTIIFGTITGVIGVVASLTKQEFEFFDKVVKGIDKVIKGIGGFSHSNWRSFSNERKQDEAKNFIDGDLVESFLDLSREKMEEVASHVGVAVDEMVKRIETFQRAVH